MPDRAHFAARARPIRLDMISRWIPDPAVPADLETLLRQGDRMDALLAALALALFWALLVLRRRTNEAVFRAAVFEAFDGNEAPLEQWRAQDSAWGPFASALLDRIHKKRVEVQEARSREAGRAAEGEGVRRRLAQVPVPVYVLDESAHVVEANREACRLFGRTREELIGHEVSDLFRRRPVREEVEWLESLLPLGLHGDASREAVRMDGTTVPVVTWSRPLDTQEDHPVLEQVVAIDVGRLNHPKGDRDVDERYRQDQILESMGRLASGVAHDFNNHLTAILGHGQILREKARGGDLEPHAEEVCQAAEQARNLTKELLAFSRTEVAYPELIELNEVILSLRQEVERVVGHGVRIDFDLDHSLEKVRMDRTQLEEIVMKLADHAASSMRGEGVLSVTTARVPESNEWVTLRVGDTGKGMDAEARTHAFEPYYTTNQGEFGSGMGLASVHGAITQNGGRVNLSSDLGRGTSVELRFPVIPPAGHESEPRRGNGSNGRQTTVCVIEDDSQVRRLISSVLEREGFRVLTANDGAEGLELCMRRGDEIDLVLADVNMPQMNGAQLSAELKARNPDTAVLFMSGFVDQESFDFTAPGGAGFLPKPFTPGELTQFIRGALRGRARRSGIVRVLVVDDEAPVRNMLQTLLAGLGYECTAVSDGDTALHELERSWYDVVITDMIMPDKDGIVTCDEIHRRFPNVRIIAMSGRAGGTAGLSAALEFGAVSTLSKPFSMDELELALNLATA